VLNLSINDLVKRTDLEEETVREMLSAVVSVMQSAKELYEIIALHSGNPVEKVDVILEMPCNKEIFLYMLMAIFS